MILRREQETDSQLAQTSHGGLRFAIDADPESGQHVGAAAALVEARAPCLAIAHPAAAMTNEAAVETLKVLTVLAPVPAVSSTCDEIAMGSTRW